MPGQEPFLRSPPFPWVAPSVAAVSAPGTSPITDPDGLLAAIRDAQVGGAFWSSENGWAGETAVVADDPGADEAIIAWLGGRTVHHGSGGPISQATLRTATLDRIAAAAYRDPFDGDATDAFGAVAILAEWRRSLLANRPIASAVGMAAWKREAIAQFLWDGTGSPAFRSPDRALSIEGTVAYWPSRVPPGFAARVGERGWVIEDGFVRSSGLGAECRPPMSILVDRTGGIYFDPARPSELETVLATHDFDAALLDRARALRAAIVTARLGKYGVDHSTPPLDLPAGRTVVLAIGQVDDDLSVVRGGAGVAGNPGFLARVRAEEPDAYILYRPHPDVAAGLRRGHLADPVISGLVDCVVEGRSLFDLIERCDGVHVLSSLTGFEALLRGRRVTVHGMPFYAGWGLTRDLAEAPSRRDRRLSLDELVAGALILVPRYRDPVTLLPCTAETLVSRLSSATPQETLITGFRRALGAGRRALGGVARR
jgi:capsular polysaccharide export protein